MVEHTTHNGKIKGLNPVASYESERKCKVCLLLLITIICKLFGHQVSKVVEHTTHNGKIKGLNPVDSYESERKWKVCLLLLIIIIGKLFGQQW